MHYCQLYPNKSHGGGCPHQSPAKTPAYHTCGDDGRFGKELKNSNHSMSTTRGSIGVIRSDLAETQLLLVATNGDCMTTMSAVITSTSGLTNKSQHYQQNRTLLRHRSSEPQHSLVATSRS